MKCAAVLLFWLLPAIACLPQGRGLTTALDGGLTARYGPVTITLRPQVIYTGNSAFPQ